MSTRPHFLEPLLSPGSSALHLVESRSGIIVARYLELAGDSKTRNRGLLGRTGLADDAALIIAPCNAVHMFFMRFAIDVVFVDRQGQVLKICRHLKPWRIGICVKAFAAVELASGAAERTGIKSGDHLSVSPASR